MNQHDILNHLTLRLNNLNEEDPNGDTLLTKYVLMNYFDQANALIQRGSDLNYKNKEGKTSLVIAIQ